MHLLRARVPLPMQSVQADDSRAAAIYIAGMPRELRSRQSVTSPPTGLSCRDHEGEGRIALGIVFAAIRQSRRRPQGLCRRSTRPLPGPFSRPACAALCSRSCHAPATDTRYLNKLSDFRRLAVVSTQYSDPKMRVCSRPPSLSSALKGPRGRCSPEPPRNAAFSAAIFNEVSPTLHMMAELEAAGERTRINRCD
jgi:hypothetical protein